MPSPTEQVRLLLLEDSDADAVLLEEELLRKGFDPTLERIETQAALGEALGRPWDAALCDYSMPGFGPLEALAIIKQRAPDLPVILVSGSVGESELVDAMRAGASDYVLKDNLSRLAASLRRELRDARANQAQREAERLRREAEERFRFVVERTGEVLYRLRFDSMTYDYISPGIEKLLGHTAAEINRLGLASLVVTVTLPAGGPLPRARLLAAREKGEAEEFWADYEVRTKSGELRWLADHSHPWRCEDGRLMGSVGLLADITKRKRDEEALRQSEARLQHVVSSSPAVLYSLKPEGRRLLGNWVSDNVEELLGFTVHEALARDWWASRLHPEDRERVFAEQAALFTEARLAQEYRFRRKDGGYRWLRAELRLLRDAAWNPVEVVGSWSDITARKEAELESRKLEAQLLQSQKMESVGRLAGGVAHDFNNLLGVITGYGDLLRKKLPEDPRLKKYADGILKAAERAADLTRQLLAFSRQQVLQPRTLDLNAVVRETEKMLRRLIGEDIELVTRLQNSVGFVRADAGQIGQVLMNLAVNARDAMPRGGRLALETSDVDLDETYARLHAGVEPGRYVMLAVVDTGLGMSREVQARIFEPFFTTKEAGKGTGLGLATVHGIVKQSRGHVFVYSEPGRGTAFKIYLPRADEPKADVERESPAEDELPRGSETILVVEDEASLRALIRESLEALGYRVLAAQHGREALEICLGHPGPIHLLMTDVVMPGMGGRELAERAYAAQRQIKVLYMSGYTDDAVVIHGVTAKDMPFLQKPFTAVTLARKVREVLDRPHDPD